MLKCSSPAAGQPRMLNCYPTPYGGVPPEPLPCPAWGHQRTEDRGWVCIGSEGL